MSIIYFIFTFFFFNDTATTEIYTTTDTLFPTRRSSDLRRARGQPERRPDGGVDQARRRSEEHTSELQSPVVISYAVFCLKKKKNERVGTQSGAQLAVICRATLDEQP